DADRHRPADRPRARRGRGLAAGPGPGRPRQRAAIGRAHVAAAGTIVSSDSSSYRALSTGTHSLVGAEVLVLDGDRGVHAGIAQLLSEAHLHVTCVTEPDRALALVARQFFSVALIDIDTPAPRDGIATIQAIKQASPTSMVIALTPRRS